MGIMKSLRSDNRILASYHIFIFLVIIGLLSVVVFYSETNSFKPRAKPTSTYEVEDRDRPEAGFLEEHKDNSVADQLYQKVRVLCWLLSHPRRHQRVHILATWGSRCNQLVIISTAASKKVPSIILPVQEGSEFLWSKMKAAFQYVYDHYRDDADWFLMVDDDTYVVVENLRYLLADHESRLPIYFGCRLKHKKQRITNAGSGYVLSRGALESFVEDGLSGPQHCRSFDHGEDFDMDKCLSKMGVVAGDTRDSLRRGRFFPFSPGNLFTNEDKKFWYWNYIYYPTDDGPSCCSEYAISFHYIDTNTMYVLDYLIYRLRPYGIEYKNGKLPKVLNINDTMPGIKDNNI